MSQATLRAPHTEQPQSMMKGRWGWVVLAAFTAIQALAVQPLWKWRISSAELGQSPDSLFVIGLFTLFAVSFVFFMLAVILTDDKNELALGGMLGVMMIGCLANASAVWRLPEMQTLGAYNKATANITQATKTLGHAPPISKDLVFPSVSAAIGNQTLMEVAKADASPEAVSAALVATSVYGDTSDHAQFVRDNAMVRVEDKAHLARQSLRQP